MNIMGASGTIYSTTICTHPGIFFVDETVTREFRCDEASGNKIIEISGQQERHQACGIYKKILIAFPPNVRPRKR